MSDKNTQYCNTNSVIALLGISESFLVKKYSKPIIIRLGIL